MLDDDASDPACVTGCAYYAQTNRLGSTILITDETGAVRESYGYTQESVDEFLDNPADSYPAAKGDTSTGGADGATVNVGESGDWAVVNDETGEVVQVNDRNNPRQPPPDRLED